MGEPFNREFFETWRLKAVKDIRNTVRRAIPEPPKTEYMPFMPERGVDGGPSLSSQLKPPRDFLPAAKRHLVGKPLGKVKRTFNQSARIQIGQKLEIHPSRLKIKKKIPAAPRWNEGLEAVAYTSEANKNYV